MHEFPLILKHRNDPHQTIVVANADQLNSVSDEFAPDEIRKNRKEGGADVGVAVAEKSIGKAADGSQADSNRDAGLGLDALEQMRKQLQADAEAISKKHAQEREQLDRERKELDEQRQAINQQAADLQQAQRTAEEPKRGEQQAQPEEEKVPGNRPELGQAGQNGKHKSKG